VHNLRGAYFLCLQGIKVKREFEMPILWEWIRGTTAVGEKYERVDRAVAFIQRVDQVGYVGSKNKDRKWEVSTDKYKSR
jgi:hypothetical protein